jgi:putative ABC transport system permease protein
MLKNAFQFMKYDIAKSIGIMSGILISVFLIGAQLGVFNSMMGNMKGMAKNNPEFIWVVNKKSQSAIQLQNIDVRVGRSLQSVQGVQNVYPVALTNGNAKVTSGDKISVQIVGLQFPAFIGGPKKYVPGSELYNLVNDGAVIIDQSALKLFEQIKQGDHFLVNDKRVQVAGLSEGMTGFGNSYVFTTLERARKLGNMDADYVSCYLVTFDSLHYTAGQVTDAINKVIPGIKAIEGKQFGTDSMMYMLTHSNIAMSFGLMVVSCLIAGFAIVGLTMFSSVKDRMKDYGTIKAIGGSNGFIRKLILTQSFLFAVFSFVFSLFFLYAYSYAMKGGQMEITYPPWLITFLIIVTFLISMLGSLFAMRKITKLEPVQIFRM